MGFGTSGVRGLVAAMTDEVCHAFALAFLRTLPAAGPAAPVVLAHDLRPSSPRIAAACAAAIRQAGREVRFCGVVPTPALALHAGQAGAAAVMVTGSHIPFDRNGIKFYKPQGEILKADEAPILAREVERPEGLGATPLPPASPAAAEGYLRRYLDFFAPGMLRGKRVGIWQHSSASRDLLAELVARLGGEPVALGRTDAFVPVDTEAVAEADQRQARAWAAEHRLDALVSTDGDGDRPLVGDEAGTWLRGDIVGLLCAAALGADTVVAPVSCNSALEKCGRFRRVVRTRIGSPYVIEAMQGAVAGARGPVVGFEANGGLLLGSPVERDGRRLAPLATRDAVLPALAVLDAAARAGVPVSGLLTSLPRRFTASDRIQDVPTADSKSLLAALSSSREQLSIFFAGLGPVAGLDQTDGLRVTLASGEVVHLRPSGNAAELRCYAEADSLARAGELAAWGLREAGKRVGR